MPLHPVRTCVCALSLVGMAVMTWAVTWTSDQKLGATDNLGFAGIHTFSDLTIGDNVQVTSVGISHLVIKVDGVLTLGRNVVIRARNGYYKEAPTSSIAALTEADLATMGTLVRGVRVYPALYGRGGDGGNGGCGQHAPYLVNNTGYGFFYTAGIGGNGGHGGYGGYGGGKGGEGGSGGFAQPTPELPPKTGTNGSPGTRGTDCDGGATTIGAHGNPGTNYAGGYAGRGNGGNGGNGGPGDMSGIKGYYMGHGGGAGGGGGYGGGVLTIIANRIVYDPAAPPKFLVSGQRGGLPGLTEYAGAVGATNGRNGEGGLLIISGDFQDDPTLYRLGSGTFGVHDLGSDNGGHGIVTGDPQRVFVIQLRPILTVSIPESATRGCGTITGTVTRSGATGSSLTVSLASSNTSQVDVPPSLTIPAGQSSATFPLTITDQLSDGSADVTISASAADCVGGSGTIVLYPPTLILTVPNVAEDGGEKQGSVFRPGPTSVSVAVTLTSSDAGEARVPATVVIPAGQARAYFPITPIDDDTVDGRQTIEISACAPGYRPATSAVQVDDRAYPRLTLTLPQSVNEHDGIQSAAGHVTISAPQMTDLVISLSPNSTSDIRIPATVLIPAGAMAATFSVTPIDDAVYRGVRPLTVSASARNCISGSAGIVVCDDEVPALRLLLPVEVREGDGVLTGRGSVSFGAPVGIPVSIALTSSDAARIAVPSTVSIPLGASEASFDMTVGEDALISGHVAVSIAARYPLESLEWIQPVLVLDNDPTLLRLSGVPGEASEADSGFVCRVALSGKLPTALSVGLTSSDPRVIVPATVNIPSGSDGAPVAVQIANDGIYECAKPVTISARAEGFDGATATFLLTDDDPHHFEFSPIASPRTASTALEVHITACDADGDVVTNYQGQAWVSAVGAQGPAAAKRQVTFTDGVWRGEFPLPAPDPGACLVATDDLGHSGASNTFTIVAPAPTVVPGPPTRFAISDIGPLKVGEPGAVTIQAVDGLGKRVTSYNGVLSLAMGYGGQTTRTVDGQTNHDIDNAGSLRAFWKSGRIQMIYPAREVGRPGIIRGLVLHVKTYWSASLYSFKVRMRHTSLSEHPSSGAWENTGWTNVYSTSWAYLNAREVVLNLSTSFAYNGHDNLMVDISFNDKADETNIYRQLGFYCFQTGAPRSVLAHMDVYSNPSSRPPNYNSDPLTWTSGTPKNLAWKLGFVFDDRAIPFTIASTSGTAVTMRNGEWHGQISLSEMVRDVRLVASSIGGPSGSSNPLVVTDDLITVSVPPTITEGQGVLVGAGHVSIGAPLASDLAVSLNALQPVGLGQLLHIPPSVVIPAGQRSAAFDITVDDDGSCTGMLVSTIVASAGEGWSARPAVLSVRDNDASDLAFVAIPAAKHDIGEPFPVTVYARDANGEVMEDYTGDLTLACTGEHGELPIHTSLPTRFEAGRWTGNVTITHYDQRPVLKAQDTHGHVCWSNPLFINSPPISALRLSASTPSRVAEGMLVTLTAIADGGGSVEYRFLARRTTADVYTPIRNWGASALCTTWQPAPGTYRVFVQAREGGSTKVIESKAVYISVTPPLTSVGLVSSPASPTAVGTSVGFLAGVTGGANVEYRYEGRRNGDAQPSFVRDYILGRRNTIWVPSEPGTYTVTVTAREQGTTTMVSTSKTYVVNPKVSALLLERTAPATVPVAVGVPLYFLATATGGGTLEYQFLWNYSTTTKLSATWTKEAYGNGRGYTFKPTEPGYYTFRAYAREKGTTANFQASSADLKVQVKPAVSSYEVQFAPSGQGPVGGPITISAINVGGGAQPQWKFWAKRRVSGATWTLIRDYAAGSTAEWRPDTAGTYDLMVYCREVGSKAPTYDRCVNATYVVK